jgi:hypothetical protein
MAKPIHGQVHIRFQFKPVQLAVGKPHKDAPNVWEPDIAATPRDSARKRSSWGRLTTPFTKPRQRMSHQQQHTYPRCSKRPGAIPTSTRPRTTLATYREYQEHTNACSPWSLKNLESCS